MRLSIGVRAVLVLVLTLVLAARPPVAHAEEGIGDLRVDAGLVVGLPAALPTGTSTGVGVGVTHGHTLAWGARVSWSNATEYTTSWAVTHADLRLRAIGAFERSAGRGSFALRLGAGGTLVHETRTRNQGMRAGLEGSDLETSAWTMLPGADLELAVALRIAGPWAFVLSGGPSLHLRSSQIEAGWIGGVGVAWQP